MVTGYRGSEPETFQAFDFKVNGVLETMAQAVLSTEFAGLTMVTFQPLARGPAKSVAFVTDNYEYIVYTK